MESQLKQYFATYITDIKKLSIASAKHYNEALRYISKLLVKKGVLKQDIYEVRSIEELELIRGILDMDQEFKDVNKRGGHMYSAGFNHYCKFAKGVDFNKIDSAQICLLDVPVPVQAVKEETITRYARSSIIRAQSLEMAGFNCEMDKKHETFIARGTKHQYMEGHHAIPMARQKDFGVSLDVYANVICLCPICHRALHYGEDDRRKKMLDRIYGQRHERLAGCGLDLSRNDFMEMCI